MMHDAVAVQGIADTSPMPSTSNKTKQKKTSAQEPVFTKQSGDAVVTASSSKSTAKKKQKEGKDDPTTPLKIKMAKNIFQKSSAKESVSAQKQRKKIAKKTPLKVTVLTEGAGKERLGDKDIRGVTVGIEHMSGEN